MPLDKLLLFWQGKELTAAYDGRTLLEMNLHTGEGGFRRTKPGGRLLHSCGACLRAAASRRMS